jgi:hypothetical protein
MIVPESRPIPGAGGYARSGPFGGMTAVPVTKSILEGKT